MTKACTLRWLEQIFTVRPWHRNILSFVISSYDATCVRKAIRGADTHEIFFSDLSTHRPPKSRRSFLRSCLDWKKFLVAFCILKVEKSRFSRAPWISPVRSPWSLRQKGDLSTKCSKNQNSATKASQTIKINLEIVEIIPNMEKISNVPNSTFPENVSKSQNKTFSKGFVLLTQSTIGWSEES